MTNNTLDSSDIKAWIENAEEAFSRSEIINVYLSATFDPSTMEFTPAEPRVRIELTPIPIICNKTYWQI
ncbi:MAG: hypothetical protein LBB49_03440 [Gracilibacteraceae bacterium]|jgi:hypothetical protein|nr:hypothetical protein [Gracilibacteraceae bacterium]